jgi:hypothetical protein
MGDNIVANEPTQTAPLFRTQPKSTMSSLAHHSHPPRSLPVPNHLLVLHITDNSPSSD